MARASQSQTVTVDGRTLKLTNLDKVLYPDTGTTKGDVLAYYAEVGPTMLPHLWQRPATRKRWPDGVEPTPVPGGSGGVVPPSTKRTVFFAKNLTAGTPDWVRRFAIQHRDHDNDYPVVDDLATLTWIAQLAGLEIHVPQWRFDAEGRPQNPDRLVLDLDPGEGVSLAEAAEVARWARDILRDIGHDPVPVTSGSKGIHLYAPLDGQQTPDQATAVARELALALEADHPDRVISSMKRSERDGKVFVDWSQNNGAKTTVSPYSLRGRPQPWVAAPRTWAELEDPDLAQLTYAEVLDHVARHGDLLAPLAPDPARLSAPERDRLSTYRSMRDAAKTPEPVPATPPVPQPAGGDPIFVIQEHHARALHWDFRLEHDGVLVSWAVPKSPPTDPKSNRLAVLTEDHPMEYATFEGGIPHGEYGGGSVSIWDSGTFRLHKWREGKEVIVTLQGRPDGGLGGGLRKYALIHTGGGKNAKGPKADRNWLMHLMAPDPDEEKAADASTFPELVEGRAGPRPASEAGVAVPAPASTDFPAEVDPMLATLTDGKNFGPEEGWAFEMKWDGVRAVAYLAGGRVRLLSRKGRDESAAYPDVALPLSSLDVTDAVLDGEIVVTDASGRPDFGLLQNRINLSRPADIERAAQTWPAQLMVFDVLELDGQSLLARPYAERREILEGLDLDALGERVHVPPVFHGDLQAARDISRQLRLEGVVAKRTDSVYAPGRRGKTWLKIKNFLTQEVVVAGWRPGQGGRSGTFGSLLMGIPGPDGLHYVGRVGSGFDGATLDDIQRRLDARGAATPALVDVPREDARDAHWVRPDLVGEVTYAELTGPGRMRHPVWRGLRPDKNADEVVWERP
jgi:bifunctional non-homologous end joining protein LigD